ncbi:MAG: hypothetical protein K0S32_2728 [Bacteroidetes bacterium]|nr:hypothetical protein [Bacteroidota bacterium]
MREILDSFYSSSITITVVFIVVLFVCVGLAFLNPFKIKALNYIYKALLYLFAFCVLMLPNFFYYGHASSFEKILVDKNTISLFESYERGGDGPSESVVRLHIVDRATGQLKDRFYIGYYGKLVGTRNDTICYMYNHDVILFDAVTMKEVYSIKEEEWGSISPDFSVGMERIGDNQNSNDPVRPYIILDCKNGKKYSFDPFSKRLSDGEVKDEYFPEFSKEDYKLSVKIAPGQEKHYLITESTHEGKLERIVPDTHAEHLFHVRDSSGYIDPFLMCLDTIRKVFVFGHYTTTDKKDITVMAKNFDFKTLWAKTTADLGTVDGDNPTVSNIWKLREKNLYFNCGGYLISMDPLTGNVNWKTRL